MSTTQSVYDRKIEEAQTIISEHNSKLAESQTQLNWDEILNKIVGLGGTTAETLSEMTWEDLEDCGIPRVLARRVAKVLRKKEEQTTKLPSKSALRVMGILDLLKLYDPASDNNHLVQKELVSRTDSSTRFIVFNDNNTVDAELSHKLWKVFKDTGLEGPITNVGTGTPRKTYQIGQTPAKTLDENPLIEGRPLIDGCCDKSNINWADVPLFVRQFVRVIIDETGSFGEVSDMQDFFERLDKMSKSSGGWAGVSPAMSSRYPESWVIFEELRDDNKLPSLVIKSGSKSKKSNNPFGSHQTY